MTLLEQATEFDAYGLSRRWTVELDLAKQHYEKWHERATKVVKRYRDERDGLDKAEKFNILWSNVQTLRPAAYSKKPKPEVSRRYNDADPVGRAASMILERCLEYEVEHYPDFDSAMRNALDDRLLAGRGVAWVRYDPNIETVPDANPESLGDDDTQLTDDAEQGGYEQIRYECAPTDYVYWKDYLQQPCRTEEECEWKARRTYLSREAGVKRFGEVFAEVPLNHSPKGLEDHEKAKDAQDAKRAVVWEIWHKPSSQVIWIAEDFDRALDAKSDPLQLDGFWPCPKPLYATTTTDSMIPIPDYCQYQDQAEELDRITARINLLEKAVKVAGVYNSAEGGIKRLLSENTENLLIPVANWGAFSEKGGIDGAVSWMPIDMVVQALQQLYLAREAVKQTIYEITGLSDIVRGASEASETATAQQIKSRFASLRIQELQNDVARFASDLFRLKAQVICKFFQPETIMQMSGAEHTIESPEVMMQALQLLKSQPIRSFRIEVTSDSMIELDVEQEKSARMEFLSAVGGFLNSALPVVQASPPLLPLLGEMLRFGVRGFKVGREVEAAFDSAMAQAQQAPMMPPEIQQQMQAKEEEFMQREQGLQQAEQGLMQTQESLKAEADKLTQDKMAFDYAQKEFNLQQQAAKEREAVKSQVERFQQAQAKEVETFKQKGVEQVAGAIGEHMTTLDKFAQQVGQALEQMAQTIAQIREEQAGEIKAVSEGVQQTQALLIQYARAKRTPVKDQNGRTVGVNIEGFSEALQ